MKKHIVILQILGLVVFFVLISCNVNYGNVQVNWTISADVRNEFVPSRDNGFRFKITITDYSTDSVNGSKVCSETVSCDKSSYDFRGVIKRTDEYCVRVEIVDGEQVLAYGENRRALLGVNMDNVLKDAGAIIIDKENADD